MAQPQGRAQVLRKQTSWALGPREKQELGSPCLGSLRQKEARAGVGGTQSDFQVQVTG